MDGGKQFAQLGLGTWASVEQIKSQKSNTQRPAVDQSSVEDIAGPRTAPGISGGTLLVGGVVLLAAIAAVVMLVKK